jgi:hypothetical protein
MTPSKATTKCNLRTKKDAAPLKRDAEIEYPSEKTEKKSKANEQHVIDECW